MLCTCKDCNPQLCSSEPYCPTALTVGGPPTPSDGMAIFPTGGLKFEF